MIAMSNGKKIKHVLLIQVPGSAKRVNFLPIGLLAVSAILQKLGILVSVFDLCIEDVEGLNGIIKKFRPDIIGFGGIATSYSSAKEISEFLHKHLPNSVYIAGGPLASAYEILLGERIVDYAFHGETEYSLPKFIKFLETGNGINDIGGISFLRGKIKDFESDKASIALLKNNHLIIRMPPEKQIADLDDCGFFDYDLVNLDRYVLDLRDWYQVYKPGVERIEILNKKIEQFIKEGKYRYLEVFTSRGCTHKCKFCHRNINGIRRFSVKHVINNIKLIRQRCAIDGLSFGDELFNSNLSWIYELCSALENSQIGISFYMAAGMRADKIDEAVINRLSQVGFIDITFGHESGSDTVLKYYGKGVSRKQNIESVALTQKYGIHSCVQLVIGSPVESMRTIRETNEFLKIVDACTVSINYIIPLPETPVWEEIVNKRHIKDVRAYLEKVRKYAGSYLMGLNISKATMAVWIFWYIFLERTVFINRYKNEFLRRLYYQTYFFKFVAVTKTILNICVARICSSRGP